MNPLTVTWAPHLYTEIGRKNFDNWIHVGGLDNLLFTPNGRFHRYITKTAFENLLHPFQPFIIGQRIIGPLMASKFNVPLVMYGENQAEYGNSINENGNSLMNEKFFTEAERSQIKFGGVTIERILEEGKFDARDVQPYLPISKEAAKQGQIEVNYLGYFLPWDPQECFYYAAEHTGFMPNSERTEGTYSKYSSIDDKIDSFHYYTTLIKFGLGRASYDAAQEIRNQKITREEGIELVKKYDTEFPQKYFSDFLEYVQVEESRFWEIVYKNISDHHWEKKSGAWRLRKPIWKA
jgi:N-acetyl sugar amidotransferase